MAGLLANLEQRMTGRDLSGCTVECLRSLSAEINRGIALLEGYATRIAVEAHQRETAGVGLVADDIACGNGEISRDQAANRTARAALGEVLPKAGAAASSGTARPENIDALTAALDRLSPTERARLSGQDADLARRAAASNPRGAHPPSPAPGPGPQGPAARSTTSTWPSRPADPPSWPTWSPSPVNGTTASMTGAGPSRWTRDRTLRLRSPDGKHQCTVPPPTPITRRQHE